MSKEEDEDTGEEQEKKLYVYQTTVRTLRRRFDHDGYTYDALERDFIHSVKARINLASEQEHDEEAKEYLAVLKKAKLDSWLRALKQLITAKERGASKRIVEALDTSFDYQIDLEIEMWPNWPASNHYYLVRAVLEVAPDDAVCEHDV